MNTLIVDGSYYYYKITDRKTPRILPALCRFDGNMHAALIFGISTKHCFSKKLSVCLFGLAKLLSVIDSNTYMSNHGMKPFGHNSFLVPKSKPLIALCYQTNKIWS